MQTNTGTRPRHQGQRHNRALGRKLRHTWRAWVVIEEPPIRDDGNRRGAWMWQIGVNLDDPFNPVIRSTAMPEIDTNTKQLDPAAMAQFTGTEHWYQHPLVRSVSYTDGVKYVADTVGAHWLVDKVATLQMLPEIKGEEFQVWKLAVADHKATLTCEDGNDHEVYREAIEFTDFPEPGISLWFTDNVILLPSEY